MQQAGWPGDWVASPASDHRVANAGTQVRSRTRKMWWVAMTAVTILAGCSTVPTSFSPSRPLATPEFSHQVFDTVVRTYVRNGQVNYPVIQVDRRFTQYLDQLDRVDPNSLPREDRLAFWINAYNAFAIKGIVDGYTPGTLVGRYRYFIGRDYRVGGKSVNLYGVEGKFSSPSSMNRAFTLPSSVHRPRVPTCSPGRMRVRS